MMNKCIIYMVINKNAQKKYKIDINMSGEIKYMKIKFIGRVQNDIYELIYEFPQHLYMNDIYEISYKYINCPHNIVINKKIKKKLKTMLCNTNQRQYVLNNIDEQDHMLVKAKYIYHLLEQHHENIPVVRAPSYNGYNVPKKRIKIKNYIEHTLNIHISEELLDCICSYALENDLC